MIKTLDADSGSEDRGGRGFERSYGNTTRWMDEAEIASVEKRDGARAAISAKDTTALSTVLMMDRDENSE